MTVITKSNGVEQRIVCGKGAWQKGRLAYGRLPAQPAAASGAWTADDEFTAKICFYETPFIMTVRLKFSGEQLLVDSEPNVTLGPATKQPRLVGVAASADRVVGDAPSKP